MLQLKLEPQIKSKTVISRNSRKKKMTLFVPFILSKGISFKHLRFILLYSVSNTLSEYTYFIYQETLLYIFFCLFLKSSKAFSVQFKVKAYFKNEVFLGIIMKVIDILFQLKWSQRYKASLL